MEQNIRDLNTFFEETDGQHVLYSGTFDPFHFGHAKVAELGRRIPSCTGNPLIIVPHSFNGKKNIQTPLSTRVRWIKESIQEFLTNFFEQIVIVEDPKLDTNLEAFSTLINRFSSRIHRVFGHDNDPEVLSECGAIPVKVIQRIEDISSTLIRESIRCGSVDSIRFFVAQKVLDEILKDGHYRD